MIIPRPYQLEAHKALLKYWCKYPKGVPLLVCPTGGGKSFQIALLVQEVLEKKPHYKIFVVTHRKELIEQNSREIYELLKIPIGIYSAGLQQKTIRSVTCAGVQSLFKKQVHADLVIVDEAHLIGPNDESMYQKLISNFEKANPMVKFCGLTATPYRMSQGSLIGSFFTDIAYDIHVRDLIDQGYLCNLISMPKGDLNFDDVSRSGYDYNQGELETKMKPLVEHHCKEILEAAKDRKSILIFCSGIEHAKDVALCMQALGEKAEYITGEMLNMERDLKIERFKNGTTRILANCEILTTGFNFPALECIVFLRATRSTGLYVQIVGRGMRTWQGKRNCLVLDFGSNIERHGPIDCIEVKIKKGQEKAQIKKGATKECPCCGAVHGIRSLECSCGYLFPIASTIELKASEAPIISKSEILEVDSVIRKIHRKEGKPDSLRIDYQCGLRTISDFLCFQHGGYATQKAQQKWKMLTEGQHLARLCHQALSYPMKQPSKIEVIKDGKYYRVIKVLEFKQKEPDLYEEFGVNI